MIKYSLRRSISLAYAGLLVSTAFVSVTNANDSEGVVRVRNAATNIVTRGQSPQIQAPIRPVQYQSWQSFAPARTPAPVQAQFQQQPLVQAQASPQYYQPVLQEYHPVSNEVATTPVGDQTGCTSQGCTSTTSCDATGGCCPTGSCSSTDCCSTDVCFSDCDPVIGRRFGRRGCDPCGTGRLGGAGLFGGRMGRGCRNGYCGDEFCGDGSCGGRRCRGRGCGGGLGSGGLVHQHMENTCAWARLKFGLFIPTGSCGYGTPPFGHYSMVYPVNPQHFDARDGQVYAAQGYAGPVAVPLAPVVNHTYNYGWGIPSSRLTPVSHPVSTSQADAYQSNQYAAPQGLR